MTSAILNPIRKGIAAVTVTVKALLTGALVFEDGIAHLVCVHKLKVQIGHVVAACHIQGSYVFFSCFKRTFIHQIPR